MAKAQEAMVSVVMPAYNARQYIRKAIESVQEQTYPHWELIVIDDGSSDETCSIVREIAASDQRIRFYENPENLGTAQTRNRGLLLSEGDYIALLDSDDLWRPQKLEKQLAALSEAGADIVYSSYALIDEGGQTLCSDYLVPAQTGLVEMLKENVIGCSTVLFTRAVAEQFQFSRSYYHEDYAFWLELLRAGKKAVGVCDVCVDYRVHVQGRSFNKFACAKSRWTIYRSCMGMGVVPSAYYLACYIWNGLVKYRHREST